MGVGCDILAWSVVLEEGILESYQDEPEGAFYRQGGEDG